MLKNKDNYEILINDGIKKARIGKLDEAKSIFLNAIEHSLVSATVIHGSSTTHFIPSPLTQKDFLTLLIKEETVFFELIPPKIG